MAEGNFPAGALKGVTLGPSRCPSPAAADWLAWQATRGLPKLASVEFERPRVACPTDEAILACFGLTPAGAQLQASRAKKLRRQRGLLDEPPELSAHFEQSSSEEEDLWD